MLKIGLHLMKNELKPLAESVLISLGLTVASATNAAIQKKIFGLGTTTLIFWNEEMNDIMKIVKSLEESCLLIKRAREKFQNEAKEQQDGFLSMLLRKLSESLAGNFTAGR